MNVHGQSITSRVGLWLVCVAALAFACPAKGAVVFSDNFESPTSTSTTWFSPDDNDPTTPVIGQNWTVVEVDPWRVQEASYAQNLGGSPPSFGPPADGGAQYLHMFHSTGSEAWASLSASDQTALAAMGHLQLSVEVFGLSGYDGWGSDLRIAGFDSAATVGANPAFDVHLVDGGYGVNGTVQYINGAGTNTAPGLVNKVDVWQTLKLDVDFNTDTFSLSLDGNTVFGLTGAGGDLAKIQSVELTLGGSGSRGSDARGGFDNISIAIPEPASVTLLGASAVMLMRRRRK